MIFELLLKPNTQPKHPTQAQLLYMKKRKSHEIILKPLTIEDAEATYQLFSLKEVADFYDSQPIEHNESAMVFTYRIIKGSNYIWKIAFKNEPEKLIGVCALHKWDATHKTIEIGGTLLPKWWNQSIMGIAFKQIIPFAAEQIGVQEILARTSPTNIQAIKLVEKLNFQRINLSVNEILLSLNVQTESNIFQRTIHCLNQEGSILYPTDTIWGLGGNALSKAVFHKINTIKKRPTSKSYIVLMKNLQTITTYVQADLNKIKSILSQTKNPTTIIYSLKNKTLQHLAAEDNTIAIRIPLRGFAKELLSLIDFPLISTSANISGASNPSTFHEITETVKQQVDYIVPNSAANNTTKKPKPSTILKVEASGEIITIRA